MCCSRYSYMHGNAWTDGMVGGYDLLAILFGNSWFCTAFIRHVEVSLGYPQGDFQDGPPSMNCIEWSHNCEILWARIEWSFCFSPYIPVDSGHFFFRLWSLSKCANLKASRMDSPWQRPAQQADPELGGFVGPGDRDELRCRQCANVYIFKYAWRSLAVIGCPQKALQIASLALEFVMRRTVRFMDWSSTSCVPLSDFLQFCAVS